MLGVSVRRGCRVAAGSTVGGVWTPTPDEDLEREITAALASRGASRVIPPKPVAHATGAGWLWGRKKTPEGSWLGLAVLQTGYFFQPGELHWYPAGELRVLGD